MNSIHYNGPVVLSCDDTKLHAILRTYWDAGKECHYIVGTTGDPIAVEDESLIQELVASAKKDAATKVGRSESTLYCTSLTEPLDSGMVSPGTFSWNAATNSGSKSYSK
jgi:hypothetical protein